MVSFHGKFGTKTYPTVFLQQSQQVGSFETNTLPYVCILKSQQVGRLYNSGPIVLSSSPCIGPGWGRGEGVDYSSVVVRAPRNSNQTQTIRSFEHLFSSFHAQKPALQKLGFGQFLVSWLWKRYFWVSFLFGFLSLFKFVSEALSLCLKHWPPWPPLCSAFLLCASFFGFFFRFKVWKLNARKVIEFFIEQTSTLPFFSDLLLSCRFRC